MTMQTQKTRIIFVTFVWCLMLAACQTSAIRCKGGTSGKLSQGKLWSYQTDGSGFHTKNFFYDTGKEVVAFDAQFTEAHAQKSIDFLRTKTKNPIRYLVITHPNPDKFNGMKVFQKLGAKVIASQKTATAISGVHAYKKYYFVQMAKMFTEKTYPVLGSVDITFDQTHTLSLSNGESIVLSELGTAGVSSNQTVAYIPTQKSYIVGDLIHHKAHAWLEGGIVGGKPRPNLQDWQKTLQQVLVLAKNDEKAKVYGGRGEEASLGEAVSQQTAYLKKAEKLVSSYIKNLGDRKAELSGAKAGQHYQALQKQFESAFPQYQLSYMIQYGVYGLVNSKL